MPNREDIPLGAGSRLRLQRIHSHVDIRRVLFVLETKPLLKRVFRDFSSPGDALGGFAVLALANENCQAIGRFEQPADIGDRTYVTFGLVFGYGHGTTPGL